MFAPNNMAHLQAYIVIAVYLLLMIAIGLVMRHLNRDASDYFRSGCKGTWWLVGASAFMGAFSAWTFSGAAGAAYESGWAVTTIYLANTLGFVINAIWLGPWFRQMRAITVPQVIEQRFGRTTQQFYAWINVLLGLIYAALWLFGLAIFVSAVFGLPIRGVVIAVGLVVLIYSVAGGSWAVMSSDFLQALVLVPITLLVGYLALAAVGGWDGFITRANDADLAGDFALFNDADDFAGKYTLIWAGAMCLKNIIGYNTINSSVRYFSVKDGREASKAAWLGAGLMSVGAIVWIIPPMVGRMLYADQIGAIDLPKPAESAYAIVSIQLLPPTLIGLMVVAMLSATMSSMDTGLNRNAAIFTHDIYPTICRWFGRTPVTGAELLRRGQLFTLAFGIIIILMTLYFVNGEGKGVFEHMLTLGAVLALPLAVPMLLAMFVRRCPGWAAMFSVAVAAVPSSIGLLNNWQFETQVFVNISVGTMAYLATIPFWRFESLNYQKQVDAFFDQMHRPVDFAREVGKGNDARQLLTLGWFAAITGMLISLLIFMPNQTVADRLSILFVAVFVAGVGGLLIWVGRRRNAIDRRSSMKPVDGSDPIELDQTSEVDHVVERGGSL